MNKRESMNKMKADWKAERGGGEPSKDVLSALAFGWTYGDGFVEPELTPSDMMPGPIIHYDGEAALLDEFAKAALAASDWSSWKRDRGAPSNGRDTKMSRRCYEIADAMLAERKKRNETKKT